MPVYEYQCAKCGEAFDIIVSLSERDAKAICPSCGARDVTRKFGVFTKGGSRTSINPGNYVKEKGRPVRHDVPPKR
jgi:putative FmdB family regulatory protein